MLAVTAAEVIVVVIPEILGGAGSQLLQRRPQGLGGAAIPDSEVCHSPGFGCEVGAVLDDVELGLVECAGDQPCGSGDALGFGRHVCALLLAICPPNDTKAKREELESVIIRRKEAQGLQK